MQTRSYTMEIIDAAAVKQDSTINSFFVTVHSYRLQSNPEGLTYDEHLNKHKGFNNPRNIETLTELLGIDTSAPCSLLRCFQRYGTSDVILHEVTHLVIRAVEIFFGNNVPILEYFALNKMVAFCFIRRLCIFKCTNF